jgi:hypothetical protein
MTQPAQQLLAPSNEIIYHLEMYSKHCGLVLDGNYAIRHHVLPSSVIDFFFDVHIGQRCWKQIKKKIKKDNSPSNDITNLVLAVESAIARQNSVLLHPDNFNDKERIKSAGNLFDPNSSSSFMCFNPGLLQAFINDPKTNLETLIKNSIIQELMPLFTLAITSKQFYQLPRENQKKLIQLFFLTALTYKKTAFMDCLNKCNFSMYLDKSFMEDRFFQEACLGHIVSLNWFRKNLSYFKDFKGETFQFAHEYAQLLNQKIVSIWLKTNNLIPQNN